MDADRTVSASFADSQDPSVFLTSPANNAVVRGTINLSASASDNVGVSRVDFYYGGVSVGNDTSFPYGLAVDSTTLSDGHRTVGARATDTSGRVSVLFTRSVIVDNHTPTVLDSVDGLEPDRGATVADLNTPVSATFSEEMKAESLTSTTFKLQMFNKKKKKWKMVPATVTYEPATRTATLDPLGNAGTLSAGKKYRGFITTGAKDLADNPLAKNFIWTFNTARS